MKDLNSSNDPSKTFNEALGGPLTKDSRTPHSRDPGSFDIEAQVGAGVIVEKGVFSADIWKIADELAIQTLNKAASLRIIFCTLKANRVHVTFHLITN